MYYAIQKRKNNMKNRKGFTLIELIVVIAILGILAAILIPQFTGFQEKARSSQALVEAKQVATALDSLLAEGKTYAKTPANATEFDEDDIAQIAGNDIAATDITSVSAVNKRDLTYETSIDGSTYTVIRDGSTGKFNTTWTTP